MTTKSYSESNLLLNEFKKYVAKSNISTLYGISFEKGNGCYLEDVDKNEYVDCLTGASTTILGYGTFQLADEYAKVAKNLLNTALLYSHHKFAVELAKKLVHIVPTSEKSRKVYFGLSGSDANDTAIKIIRKYTGKFSIIHFKYAYHGTTGLSQSASGFKHLKNGIYKELPYHIELRYPKNKIQAQSTLRKIKKLLETGKIGGMIAELIQGDGGNIIPDKDFFKKAVNLLHDHGAIFVADEVQSGMGRTGKWWSYEHEKILPDLVVIGKGLAAGYSPMSCVIGNSNMMNSLDRTQALLSYSGNPPGCHVALKTIEIIEKENILKKNQVHGLALLKSIHNIAKKNPDIIKDVRGRGLMLAMEINDQKNSLLPKIFAKRGVDHGIYWGFFGSKNHVIRIQPPFIISKKEIQKIIDVIELIVEEIKTNKIPLETREFAENNMFGI